MNLFSISIFVTIIVIALIIMWFVAIISCITSELTLTEKSLWIIILLLFNIIGGILYFVIVIPELGRRKKDNDFVVSKREKLDNIVCENCGEEMAFEEKEERKFSEKGHLFFECPYCKEEYEISNKN